MTWSTHLQIVSLGALCLLGAGCAGNKEAKVVDANRVTPLGGNARLASDGTLVTWQIHTNRTTGVSTPSVETAPESTPTPVATTTTTSTTTTSPTRPETARPARTPATTPPPAARPVTRYVDATSLNVRASAGTGARVTDRLDRNQPVTVLSETTARDGQRWARIAYQSGGKSGSGWVASNYLASAVTSVPAEPAAPAATRAASGEPKDEYFAKFDRLNYQPIPKPSYPGNPRVNAKGVYVSLNILSSDRFDEILKMVDSTEINALVIDYKDDVGWLLTDSPTAARLNPAANAKAKYADISDLIKRLKAKNIYLIARIVTFKDPMFARTHPEKSILDNKTGRTFKSGDGLAWASPHDPDFQDYNLGIAKEAARAGFNEIQFDYIRFPDVPKSADLNYRNPSGKFKAQAIQEFLLKARAELSPLQVYIAADVFGMVTTTVDDMRIGQYWEAVSNAVDYICPMMYPSHYANTVYGLPVPDARPYDLIYRGLEDAKKRDANLRTPAAIRPWLQGFTATWVKGHISYGPTQIKAQIKAAKDQGVDSYLIWHPTGSYNPAAYR